MGQSLAESIRELEQHPDADIVRVKIPIEYGALLLGLEDAVVEACFKLDITILEKQVTGFVFKNMYLKVEGRADRMLVFFKWLDSLLSE